MTPHLIDELTAVCVVLHEDLRPEFRLTTFDKITGLLLEHRVVVGDRNKLVVAEAFGISDVGQIGITGLAELANNQRFIQLFSGG